MLQGGADIAVKGISPAEGYTSVILRIAFPLLATPPPPGGLVQDLEESLQSLANSSAPATLGGLGIFSNRSETKLGYQGFYNASKSNMDLHSYKYTYSSLTFKK